MLEVQVHHEGVKTYELVPASSRRQKGKLIDSDRFTYNVKSRRRTNHILAMYSP